MARLKITLALFVFRLLDLIGALCNWFGHRLVTIRFDNVLRSLSRDAKKELQKPEIYQPFKLLCDCLEKETALIPSGVLKIKLNLIRTLETRAKVVAAVEADPSIREVPITKPIILLCPQRSGSTYLNNILTQDPRLKGLILWECESLIPFVKRDQVATDPRISELEDNLEIYYGDIQILRNSHNTPAGGTPFVAHEATTLLKKSGIMVELFDLYESLGEYSRYLMHPPRDHVIEAYKFLKLQLQVLGKYQGMNERRFVFKMHTFHAQFDALLEVFPDAAFVCTHRDPARAIPSSLALRDSFHRILGRPSKASVHRMANRYADDIAAVSNDSAELYVDGGTNRLDIYYTDLKREPIAQVERIYDFLGIVLSDDVRLAIKSFVDSHQYNEHGAMRYTLEEFGFQETRLRELFKKYISFHNL